MTPEELPEELDYSGVANAGIRDTPLVHKIGSYSAALSSEPAPAPVNYGQALTMSPPTVTTGTGSPQTDTYAAGVLGTIESKKNGTPIYETIAASYDLIANTPDAGGAIKRQITKAADQEFQKGVDLLTTNLTPQDKDKVQQAFSTLYNWRQQANNNFGGFEILFTPQINEGIMAVALSDNSTAKERAFRQNARAVAGQVWDSTNWKDTAWDFAKTALGISTVVTMSQWFDNYDSNLVRDTLDALGDSGSRLLKGNYKGKGYQAYQDTLNAYWKEDAQTRMFLFAGIEKHIRDIAGDNKLTYTGMIAPFINKEDEQYIALDYAADTATIAAPVLTKLGRLYRAATEAYTARKPVKILIESGNKNQAAEILNNAIKDQDKARATKVTGQTPEEVAASLHPVDMSASIPGQIKGAVKEAADQIEQEILIRRAEVQAAFNAVQNPANKVILNYFDDAAKAARQREIIGKLNEETASSARIVSSDDDGFTVEIFDDSWAQNAGNSIDIKTRLEVTEKAIDDVFAQKIELEAEALQYRDAGYPEDFIKNVQEERLSQIEAQAAKLQQDHSSLQAQLHESQGPARYQVKRYNYRFDEMGQADATEQIGYLEDKLKSPIHTMDRLVPDTVARASLVEFQEQGMMHKLQTALTNSRRGMSRGEAKVLDKMLLHGDDAGRVFDVRELIDGVDTNWGRLRFTSKNQIAAYYAARDLADGLHTVKNATLLKNLQLGNYKELITDLKYADGSPIKLFTKESAFQQSVPDGVKRILNMDTGKIEDVKEIKDLQDKLTGGVRKIARLRTGQRFGDEVVNYVVIDPLKIKEPSGNVLRYVNGYVPRLREGVNYVVREKVKRKVDGVMQEDWQVARFFTSRTDAEKFKLSQTESSRFEVMPDKSLKQQTETAAYEDDFDSLNFGGLYDGERTRRDILMGLDGEVAERQSAIASLSRYINHVSNRYSTMDLKNSLIGKFQNTWGDYLKNPGDWRSALKDEAYNNLKLRTTIEAHRTYINDMMRMPDSFNDWMTDRVRATAEWFDGKPLVGNKISKGVMSLATKDPIGALKTTSFHMYLGVWNPRSLLTQAFGMTIAMTAYPTKALKLLPQSFAVRASLFTKDPQVLEANAKAAGISGKWLKNVREELEKANLLNSLFSSGDLNAAVTGMGYTKEMMNKVGDSGLIFMKEGESWTRIYGYLLARDIATKGKPAGYKLSDKEIANVIRDSLKYTLNLNRSAKAFWQKGLLAIPTQFWQVMTKFGENLAAGAGMKGTKQWTTAEKTKIMLGHIALFGAAGFPYLDSMYNMADNVYIKHKKSEEAPDQPAGEYNILDFTGLDDMTRARLIQGGLVDTLAYMMTGTDLDVAKGVSIPGGIQDMIELYQTQDKTLSQVMSGAAGPALARMWKFASDAGKDTQAIERLGTILGLNDIVGIHEATSLTDQQKWSLLRDFAGIASSTRNFATAAWWDSITGPAGRRGLMLSSNGQALMDMSDAQGQAAIVATALGVQSAQRRAVYDAQKGTAQLKAIEAGRVDAAVKYLTRFINESEDVDTPEKRAQYRYVMHAATVDLPPEVQSRVAQRIAERLVDLRSPIVEKLIPQAILQMSKYPQENQPKELKDNLLLTPKGEFSNAQ